MFSCVKLFMQVWNFTECMASLILVIAWVRLEDVPIDILMCIMKVLLTQKKWPCPDMNKIPGLYITYILHELSNCISKINLFDNTLFLE